MVGTINGVLQDMIQDLIDQIIQNPLFLKLNNVVENGPYHNHEDVYSHVTKVKDIAQKEINGDFITNPEAKERFNQFMSEDIHGYKRADIMVLIALLHDIGKTLTVKEGETTHPILVTNEAGVTACPGHEYWGSTIVNKLLTDLPKKVVEYIESVIRNHDTFNPSYFSPKANMSQDLLMNDVKSRAEGVYIEALFNIYCDCFTAEVFKETKEKIIKLFNEASLYERREYVHN